MNDIDTTLRETMRSYAEQAPPAAELLQGAQARAGALRRRRQLGMATAVAAVAAVTAVAAPPLLLADDAEPIPPFTEPAAADLAPPTFAVPEFPFTPGWAPEGLSEPYVDLMYGSIGLVHPPADPTQPPPLRAVVSEQPPPEEPLDDQEPVSVRGEPGELHTGEWSIRLEWQHESALWVTVFGSVGSGVTAEDVQRYAEELVEQPSPAVVPFTFDHLPAGALLAYMDLSTMSFEIPGGGVLRVSLRYSDDVEAGPGIEQPAPSVDPTTGPIRETASIYYYMPVENGWTVEIYLDEILAQTASEGEEGPWPVDAFGIEVTQAAQPVRFG